MWYIRRNHLLLALKIKVDIFMTGKATGRHTNWKEKKPTMEYAKLKYLRI